LPVADGGDACEQDFAEAFAGAFEEGFGGLLEVFFAVVEVERCASRKTPPRLRGGGAGGVDFDEGQDVGGGGGGGFGRVGVGFEDAGVRAEALGVGGDVEEARRGAGA